MAKNVFLGKGLWDYVSGDEVRPRSIALATLGCGAVVGAGTSQVTLEQKKWDTKDSQAMAVIALTIKRTITPHIRSCSTSEDAWNTLQDMFGGRNAARIEFLKKQLDKIQMEEGDDIVEHLTKIRDEKFLSIDEVIPEKDLVSKTLNSLPPSYLTFQTSLTLSLRANPEPLHFEELVALLLQEDQSRKNNSLQVDGMDHALVVHNKNKGKESAHHSKSGAGQLVQDSLQRSLKLKNSLQTLCRILTLS
ncbi:hypothetical protein GOP47_0020113 [Adiantum capillus-veneris]|uniref:Uncharacterized protein n=1 Tax=Adiantum capillus-veneris TaxID=13818 RepID=A0A9D4UDB5_ADICA|nr:hypothetical protein GOP47_0020113 [Adiantum capillus-veneris]